MAYDSSFTSRYKLPYFAAGNRYSSRADFERFVTLERHFDSYVGVVGVGVIDGWEIVNDSNLTVSMNWGEGFINGYYSESGWIVKNQNDVTPDDQVITEDYYEDSSTGDVYSKVFYRQSLTLPDNANVFLYSYRNANYSQTIPYLVPDNDNPTPETSNTINPSRTAVAFGYTSTQSQASSSGRVFIGLVVTRNGSVAEVDVSKVDTLADMEAAIKEFGDLVINAHRHGGTGDFDPPAVRMQTDRRSMVLSGSSDSHNVFTAKNSDLTSESQDHRHTYYVDSSGDGITVDVFGDGNFHFHDVSTWTVGGVKGGSIAAHTHDLELPEDRSDGWSQTDPVQIYVNSEAYDGSNAVVSASNKTVTFTGDVTVKYRKYGIDHNGWIFESEEKSLYRFMLRASIQYYTDNPGTTNIILPDAATPVWVLKNQAIAGEGRLVNKGDTFLFVADAASDVAVTLVEAGHVDEVEIEILTNSEVQGQLPQDNILYIPASRIVAGTFRPEAIPTLSHLGRFLEIAEPRPKRMKSSDGRIYSFIRDDVFSNTQMVYSVVDDNADNYVISTSDGMYRRPAAGAFLFVANGEQIITDPGDIRTRLASMSYKYQQRTGKSLVIDSFYDSQITDADYKISAIGDQYNFIGPRNESAPRGYDDIWLFFVQQYRLTEYGYTATRTAGEIKSGEEIIREVSQEDEEADPLYFVKNDFHSNTAKVLKIKQDLISGYDGSTVNRIYSVASDQISMSSQVDTQWGLLDESAEGYVYDLSVGYSGSMGIAYSGGLRLSILNGGRGFRPVIAPLFGAECRAVQVGFEDRIVAAYDGNIAVSDDYGRNWSTSSLSSFDICSIMFDPSLDVTTIVASHSHVVSINNSGNGESSEVSGHVHSISSGTVSSTDGHSHGIVRTYYATSSGRKIYRSQDSGTTWSEFASVPDEYSEYGTSFAFGGLVYVATDGKVISTDGTSWTDVTALAFSAYSSSLSFDYDSVLIGAENVAYSFDGTTATTIYSASGIPVPAVYHDIALRKFGYYVNNPSNSVDMGGDMYVGSNLDIIDSFDYFYPEQEGWSDGIEYDLYFDDRLLLSTRRNIDRSGDRPVSVSNVSVIDFSVKSVLAADIWPGASYIDVVSGSDFPQSGTVRIAIDKSGNQAIKPTYYFEYYAVSGNRLLLTNLSIYTVTKDDVITVDFVPDIDGDNIVRITVYEGKLTNVGINTHEDVEDALSTNNIGLGWELSNVYLSNFIHLTAALNYAHPDIDAEYENSLLSSFNYNDIPGDPNNIDRHIDVDSSDLASLSLYSVDGQRRRSSSLPRLVAGFGNFAGKCLSASSIGLFIMDCSNSLERNWFRLDVDGSVSCYDVMQHRSDVIYVLTEKGTYVNSDDTLTAWTKLNEDVIGGIPNRIVPRWSTLVDEETGIDYWWGDWNGLVHSNPALVNTIIVSGPGFMSYSDDNGVTWFDGKIYDGSGSLLEGMEPIAHTLLRNGTMVLCAKSSSGSLYGVYVTTGTGRTWNPIYSVSSVTGSIKSMSVTDQLNVKITVEFESGQPSDGSLIGRYMTVGAVSSRVLSNSGSTIIVFGDDMTDTTSTSFEVRPWAVNSIHEDSEKRISLGSSVGMLWDGGGLFSEERKRDGSVVSVGNRAVISSVNISGTVESVIPLATTSVMSASVDQKIRSNELKDMSIIFISSIPQLKVVSNSATKPDGTVDLVVDGSTTDVKNGYRFTIRGEGIRLYVTFDGLIGKDELKGGSLVPEPISSEAGLVRENLAIFTVAGNTSEYIDLSADYVAPLGYDPFSVMIPGTAILSSDSEGVVPVTVDFDTQRGRNELRGNQMMVRGSEVPDDGEIDIVGNNEIVIFVKESYTAGDATYSVFNTLENGIDFYLSGLPFFPRNSFSDKKSSFHNGHRHQMSMIAGPITGQVDSFGVVTASRVELVLTEASKLSDSFLVANPTLFAGADVLVYDPDNTEVYYELEVASCSANSITVVRKDSSFDFSGADSKKIGSGYNVSLVTIGYGRTTNTELNSNYVVTRSKLTDDALRSTSTFTVVSTSGIQVGGRVKIVDDNGLSFESSVSVVSGLQVTITGTMPYDFLVTNNAMAEVPYWTVVVADEAVAADVDSGDITVQVSDASLVNENDIAVFYDNLNTYEEHVVLGVIGNVVTMSDEINAKYQVSQGARISFRRKNSTDNHSHLVRDGQFDVVQDVARQNVGDSLNHGHYLTGYIEEVLDMKTVADTTYIVGSGSEIYSTGDNGETWAVDFDLDKSYEFLPLPSNITGVYMMSAGEIAYAASSGYYAYRSIR